MLNNLCLNIVRVFFLIQGILWGGLASIIRDPDMHDNFEARSYSGYMLFDNPEMLPEEYLEVYLWIARIVVASLPVALIYRILQMAWGF